MKINIFELAGIELQRENKNSSNLIDLLDRAIKIRKWIDKHNYKVAERILKGDKVYQYKNKIKTYCRV